MKTVDILGNGVAAIIMAYSAAQQGLDIRVWGPKGVNNFNTACPGARFINHMPHMPSLMLDAMAASQGLSGVDELETCTIDGGVLRLTTSSTGKITGTEFASWADLLVDKNRACTLTKEYAISSGRAWSPDCLFSVVNWEEVPRIYSCPGSYEKMVSYMAGELTGRVEFRSSGVFAVGNSAIVDTNGVTYDYEFVCNTVPLWLSTFLPVTIPEIRRTTPRYALVQPMPEDERTGVPSIIYYIYTEGVGGPIKRVSYDGGLLQTVEYTYRPAGVNGILELPPNIHMVTTGIEDLLNDHRIYSIGRFAQMQPKIYLNDMFDRAAYILDNA